MPRSPLTKTIKRAEGMVHYVQENLSAEEYMLFLDMVDPLPEPAKKPQKKSSKKAAGGGGAKSKHASSLESAIKGQCVATLASTGKSCGMARPHVIHSDHNQDVDAHDFLSAAQLNKSLQGQRKATADDDDKDTSSERCEYELSYGKCMQSADGNLHHLTSHPNYHEFQPPASSAAGASGD